MLMFDTINFFVQTKLNRNIRFSLRTTSCTFYIQDCSFTTHWYLMSDVATEKTKNVNF